jgi:hypothetical protein
MTRNISTTARRTVTSTLAALVLAVVLPQAGFAATQDAGIWRIDSASARFGGGFATLTIEREGQGVNPAAGKFIVISKGNVYLVTGASASDVGKGIKQVDYTNTKDGSAVLIGTNARSTDHCGLRCIQGAPDPRMTVTFKAVNPEGQQVKDMLAYNGPKP